MVRGKGEDEGGRECPSDVDVGWDSGSDGNGSGGQDSDGSVDGEDGGKGGGGDGCVGDGDSGGEDGGCGKGGGDDCDSGNCCGGGGGTATVLYSSSCTEKNCNTSLGYSEPPLRSVMSLSVSMYEGVRPILLLCLCYVKIVLLQQKTGDSP